MAKKKSLAPPKLSTEYSGGVTAASRYETLAVIREPYLRRARECSVLTIPALIPLDGFNSQSYLPTPYQMVGARGVTSLASKLVLALFPPNSPFFRFYIPEELLNKIIADNNIKVTPDFLAELDRALSKAEKKIMWEFETLALRSKVHEVVEHLIVGGNVLFYAPPRGTSQVFHLDQYVVHRAPAGDVLEIVVKEPTSWGALPESIRAKLPESSNPREAATKSYNIFTRIHRPTVDDDFMHYQEVEGYIVPGSEGVYRKNRPMPWLPQRWRPVDGSSYGRSFCEELLGGLSSLESLTRSTVVGAAASSKVLFLVKPNSTTRIKTLVDAPSGAIREGNPDDVGVLQVQKHNDMRMAIDFAAEIERQLNECFMLAQSVTRNAERVTATEIQMLAQELEDTLGGVYTLLSQEMQRPIVSVLMERMRATGKLALPVKDLEIHILTGLEALGRTADLRRLDTFIAGVAETVGPQAVAEYVVVGEYLQRRASALAIETGGLIRSELEVQQSRQAAQQAEAMARMGPSLMKGATDMQKNLGQAEADGVVSQGSTEGMMDAARNLVTQP